MFLHKSGRGTSATVGVTRIFVLFAGELHPPSVTQDIFYTLGTSLAVRCPELGDVRYSVFLLYINHSEFSWYTKHCPLLGRGPLLGPSVNGELTVCVVFAVFACHSYQHNILEVFLYLVHLLFWSLN